MDDEDEDEVDIDELYVATNNEKKVSELDVYMSEGLVKATEGDAGDAPLDILSWWRGQVTNFPILSTLARDVLSMKYLLLLRSRHLAPVDILLMSFVQNLNLKLLRPWFVPRIGRLLRSKV